MGIEGNRVTCDDCGVVLEIPLQMLREVRPGQELSPVQEAAEEQGWTNDWEGQEPGDRCFHCSPPPDQKEIGVSTPEF